MPAPMAPTLKNEYPDDISHITRYMSGGGMELAYQDKSIELNINYVDQDYFDIFTTELKEGTSENALSQLNNIVLTEKDATKIFGSEKAVGKILQVKGSSEDLSYIVSAVIKAYPRNSTIESKNLIRFESYPNYQKSKDAWGWQNHAVYLRLTDNVVWTTFEQKLKAFTAKYYKGDIELGKESGFVKDDRGELISTRLLPFEEEHFNTEVGRQSINYYYPLMLFGIGILILCIASINFVNLSIVKSIRRAREVGMRKALGALNSQVMGQFWGEAVLICFISLIIGLLSTYFVIPYFNDVINGDITFSGIWKPEFLIFFMLGFFCVTALAGGYPAWFISRFDTIDVLKGITQKGVSSGNIKNGLIIAQFSISVLLIACTIIAWSQMDYLKNKPLGFNQKQVISIPVGHGVSGEKLLSYMRNELSSQPEIICITGADVNLGQGKDNSNYKSVFGFGMDGKEYLTHGLNVEFDYIETLDLELVAGRSFDRQFSTDSTEACIINETMAKQLGGLDALDKVIPIEGDKKIIGIVKDYHFESLKNKIASTTMFFNKPFGINYIFVKIQGNAPAQAMDILQKAYLSYHPKGLFLGSFLDENTKSQYDKEAKISKIFTSAAILAIILSALGLFAVALLVIRNRTKEIGVRKVLGANVLTLVHLLNKQFLAQVCIAIVIAIPIAYYFMHNWLQEFSFRTEIEWWMLFAAGIIAIGIAFFTVSLHSIRAANANPVTALRSE